MAKLKTGIRENDFKKYFKYNSDEEVYEVDTKILFDLMLTDSVDIGREDEFAELLSKKFEEVTRDKGLDTKLVKKLVKNWYDGADIMSEAETFIVKGMLTLLNDMSRGRW